MFQQLNRLETCDLIPYDSVFDELELDTTFEGETHLTSVAKKAVGW